MSAQNTYKLWLVIEDDAVRAALEGSSTLERSNENAGFDLLAAEDFKDEGPALLNLGVRAMMTRLDTGEPVHYWLGPRSSIYKTGYVMANSLGVIDSSYRGLLKAPVVCVTTPSVAAGFKQGQRYFQILAPDMGWIKEVEIVSTLPETARGDGGFGSTGT